MVLSIAMLTSMGSVFAEDVGSDGMVEVASYVVDLGEGLLLRKSLSVAETDLSVSPRAGYGFAGIRSASVSHRYIVNGAVQAEIRGDASFASTLGQDVCYLQAASNRIVKEGQYPFYLYENITEDRESNIGSTNRYAQYSVSYVLTAFNNINDTMWIRCDSNGNSSNNSKAVNPPLEPNQICLGNSIVTFG